MIQRRGRLVGNHQLRLADQRAGGGDALLLADGQRVGAALQQFGLEPQVLQQLGSGFIDAAVALDGAARAARREAAGQLDVLAHGEERQQVELLEDVAGMVDAKTVARAGGHLRQLLAE